MGMDKSKNANAALLYMLAASMGGLPSFSRTKDSIPESPCLQCGKTKRHNNAFCSADCCRKWKAKKA